MIEVIKAKMAEYDLSIGEPFVIYNSYEEGYITDIFDYSFCPYYIDEYYSIVHGHTKSPTKHTLDYLNRGIKKLNLSKEEYFEKVINAGFVWLATDWSELGGSNVMEYLFLEEPTPLHQEGDTFTNWAVKGYHEDDYDDLIEEDDDDEVTYIEIPTMYNTNIDCRFEPRKISVASLNLKTVELL